MGNWKKKGRSHWLQSHQAPAGPSPWIPWPASHSRTQQRSPPVANLQQRCAPDQTAETTEMLTEWLCHGLSPSHSEHRPWEDSMKRYEEKKSEILACKAFPESMTYFGLDELTLRALAWRGSPCYHDLERVSQRCHHSLKRRTTQYESCRGITREITHESPRRWIGQD